MDPVTDVEELDEEEMLRRAIAMSLEEEEEPKGKLLKKAACQTDEIIQLFS